MADDSYDFFSSPLAQLLIPAAAAAAGAISPRYGGAAVQGGLGAIGALQNYKLEGARLQELRQQASERQHSDEMIARYLSPETAPAGGNTGAPLADQSKATDAATNSYGGGTDSTTSRVPAQTPVPRPGTVSTPADSGGPQFDQSQRLALLAMTPEQRRQAFPQMLLSQEKTVPVDQLSNLDFTKVPKGVKLSGKLNTGANFEYTGQGPDKITNPFEAYMAGKDISGYTPPEAPSFDEKAYQQALQSDPTLTRGKFKIQQIQAGRTPATPNDRQTFAAEYRQQRPGASVAEIQRAYAANNNPNIATPEQIASIAKGLVTNDPDALVNMNSLVGRGAANRIDLYTAAKQLDPKFSPAATERKLKLIEDYTSGDSSKQLASFGTWLEHAGGAMDALQNVDRSNVPALNKPLSFWQKNISGDAGYQQFITSLEPVRTEAANFLKQGYATTVQDQQAIHTILDDNSSPQQITAAIRSLGHVVKARFNELNFRYKRTIGRDLDNVVSPEAQEGARKIGLDLGGGAPGGAPAQQPVAGGQPQAVSKSGRPIKQNAQGQWVYAD